MIRLEQGLPVSVEKVSLTEVCAEVETWYLVDEHFGESVGINEYNRLIVSHKSG